MAECVFCRIVKRELPCFKVYEDERVLAFEDINPIAEGHTLIIPKRHAENLWEISEEDLAAIHLASKKVAHVPFAFSFDPAKPAATNYGSTFFMATGFHGFHVIVGTIFLIASLSPGRRSQFVMGSGGPPPRRGTRCR